MEGGGWACCMAALHQWVVHCTRDETPQVVRAGFVQKPSEQLEM